jgi:hypothetical protein
MFPSLARSVSADYINETSFACSVSADYPNETSFACSVSADYPNETSFASSACFYVILRLSKYSYFLKTV